MFSSFLFFLLLLLFFEYGKRYILDTELKKKHYGTKILIDQHLFESKLLQKDKNSATKILMTLFWENNICETQEIKAVFFYLSKPSPPNLTISSLSVSQSCSILKEKKKTINRLFWNMTKLICTLTFLWKRKGRKRWWRWWQRHKFISETKCTEMFPKLWLSTHWNQWLIFSCLPPKNWQHISWKKSHSIL